MFLPHHCGEQEAVVIVRCQSDRGEFVKQVKPDVLIIMTYGGSGITKALLGSVTEEVLQSLDVDILAVPPIR
ncbi:MAG: universal stress protein [Microvirga sp.]|nr:universal stress protein [Microvirga sp.]MDF2971942.1 universal stress protein [Microvirga sp.]